MDEDIADYIDEVVNNADLTDADVFDDRYRDLTVSHLADIVKLAKSAYMAFSNFDCDILLLMWLKKRGIGYEIVSEFDFDRNKYKGYVFLEL